MFLLRRGGGIGKFFFAEVPGVKCYAKQQNAVYFQRFAKQLDNTLRHVFTGVWYNNRALWILDIAKKQGICLILTITCLLSEFMLPRQVVDSNFLKSGYQDIRPPGAGPY